MPQQGNLMMLLANLLNAKQSRFGLPPLLQAFMRSSPVGLTGLDPKFIQDPRFDYITKLVQNQHLSEDNPNPWLVLMGNPQADDFDSAPIGAKSRLAVDEPNQAIMGEMEQKATGPSPWFLANIKDIQQQFGSKTITPAMAEEMRRRMLANRQRIEDRY